MAPPPLPEGKRKANSRRSAYIVLGVMGMVMLVFVGWHISLARRIEGEFERLKASGVPTSVEELTREYRLLGKSATNSAPDHERAFAATTNFNLPRSIHLGGESGNFNPSKIIKSSKGGDLREILKGNEKAYSLLKAAVEKGPPAYDQKFEDGFSMLLPHLPKTKTAMHLVELHALVAFEDNRKEDVLGDIRLIFKMSESLSAEPDLIASLVRVAITRAGCQMVENAVNSFPLSDQELKSMDEQLRGIDSFSQLMKAFHYERIVVSELFRNPSRTGALLAELSSTEEAESRNGPGAPRLLEVFKATGIWQRDFLYYLKTIDEFEKLCALPYMERLEGVEKIENNLNWEKEHVFRPGGLKIISGMMLPALGKAVRKHLYLDALTRVTRSGIAVERFRLKNGKTPESLEELVPVFLEELPLDEFSGGALQYKVRENGYVIYSVGDDGEENDGKVSGAKGVKGVDDIPFTRVFSNPEERLK